VAENSKLSAQDWAEVVSELVDVATSQENRCEDLLNQLKAVISNLQGMPTTMARQTASLAVEGMAERVGLSVEKVLGPAEARAQNLLRSMDAARHTIDASAESYRRVVRNAMGSCIVVACASAGVTTTLLVLGLKFLGLG
jgi:DNA-binding FrmR family transcriptional regulator